MLVVTIPAYNEEETIGDVIRGIPRDLYDDVRVIVIDDGSRDNTVGEAKAAGADLIHRFKANRGLAQAFKKGIDLALEMGAEVIVNIDADGQYDPEEIPKLYTPIIEGKADVVLGSRFMGWIEWMPRSKRIGNKIASKVTSFLTGTSLTDSQTGFRAFSREAALSFNVLSKYTYVQETIIQAALKGMTIMEVPIKFKKRKGESRLITSTWSYALRGGPIILRTYRDYNALRVFAFIGGLMILLGIIFGSRVLIHFAMTGMVSPYYPSAVLSGFLVIIGFQIIVFGLIADMVGKIREVMEEILVKIKK